ncbi:MAG: NAD(P)/FAD-dependent oxidoreductase [Rhodospirillaceae bacterium]|nr:NAD(P)/FAD-dependent oxidoreductase [Rhodospirillaceae bacterium]
MRHVIIGAGPAGVVAAETLRREDPAAQVTLICGEAGPPYSRMAIPYAMAGKIVEEGTWLRQDPGHFDALGVTVLHDRVSSIDPAARLLSLAQTGNLAYDRLLIATGSSPARGCIPAGPWRICAGSVPW